MLKFSVIVPTFERPTQLAECLKALAGQDFSGGFEVLIVNDGGKLDIVSVLSRFSEALNIRLLEQENSGPASARNRGAREATAKALRFWTMTAGPGRTGCPSLTKPGLIKIRPWVVAS
jgi:glycosyltransferase involved in cell wall biosynthesis